MTASEGGRILLVDDEPQLLEVLADALRDCGFAVDTAPGGEAGLARLRAREPEVVVADVDMPGMNGYELCRQVRAGGLADIPFLFCSGRGEPDARLQGLQAGADDYIVKPPALEELVLKLTRQVARVRRLRATAGAAAPLVDAATLGAIEAQLRGGNGEVARLGRFEIRDILGRGSMGTVFRAWDLKLERWVAIKTVGAGVGMADFWDEDLVHYLVVEAAMAARFNHPHVVTVHDVQEAADAAYIVMELVDGVSLQELLRHGARLGPEYVVPLLAAIARALAAAHAIELVHRDVKPANVLLGADGGIKLTDFGIASFVSAQMRDAMFGTPGYLAPEILLGATAEPASDLFALGAVAYRCLTGRTAFGGRTTPEILTNTVNVRPPLLREAGIDVPPELAAIVGALLEPDPKRRLGDAGHLAGALERLAALQGWRWTLPTMSVTLTSGEESPEFGHGQVLTTFSGTAPESF